MEPPIISFETMGARWKVTIWDDLDQVVLRDIQDTVIRDAHAFEQTYSRFIPSSLVWSLPTARGKTAVPRAFVSMLRLYEKLYDASGGKCTPLLGKTLSDMGYDIDYSLTPKAQIAPVPALPDAVTILDDEHIDLKMSVLFDLGAVGKGFFVDIIASLLRSQGIRRFLVDGSGDIYYQGDGQHIRAGLEHPGDGTKAIGVVEMTRGAMCASSSNRRRWAGYHHIVNPHSLESPAEILSTWVMADSAALADGLATCLFLCAPEELTDTFRFEYCILSNEYRVKRSEGFKAEMF